MKKVITISREFGSGGREIGFRLAEKLEIHFHGGGGQQYCRRCVPCP